MVANAAHCHGGMASRPRLSSGERKLVLDSIYLSGAAWLLGSIRLII